MNLLTTTQIRAADVHTISNQRITSIALMEQAAVAFARVFVKEVTPEKSIAVICGPGNNGGDGLAIARLLFEAGYTSITVYLASFSHRLSPDNTTNLERLKSVNVSVIEMGQPADVISIEATVIIDAIFGSGLNKPLSGEYKELAEYLDSKQALVYAVDVPSGFPSEGVIAGVAVKAGKVICFQRPKINFFFPESAAIMQGFTVADIGLDEQFIEAQQSSWKLTTSAEARHLLKPRLSFSHKGTYGHALLVAGSEETMGAALLSARACMLAGAGLITASIPRSGLTALNTVLPEAMYLPQTAAAIKRKAIAYTAAAIGPGLGTGRKAEDLLEAVLASGKGIVIDADGLNLLGASKDILQRLPENTILTPHMKEFDRLFGEHKNWWARVQTAIELTRQRKLIIVLKNQYTFVVSDGIVHINTTGNPAMASGGMGDALTGVIVSLLAQGYASADAARLGCYIHGRAGDELAASRANVTASMVIEKLPGISWRLAIDS